MLENLLAGLFQGYEKGLNIERDRLTREETKKLQVKIFKHDLEQKERTEQGLKSLIDALSSQGSTLPSDQLGPTKPKRGLSDILADPQGQAAALSSGMKLDDIRQFQQPNISQLLQQLTGGGAIGAPTGGMEITGLKIGPNGQLMPDLSRPKFKMEVASPDGMSMIQLDEFGKEMGRRPMGPGEKKPPSQTKGQSATDEAFAKEYAEFKAAGGYSSVEKGLAQLTEASNALEKGGLTGPVRGNTPDLVRQFTNPQALAIRDSVQEVVQANLRQVLGPQFTQKEGEGVMARAYNEKLPDAENKKRLDRLIKQIRTAALAKQEAAEFFEKNGTLTGFKGKLWTAADFRPDKDEPKKPTLKGPGPKVVDFNSLP